MARIPVRNEAVYWGSPPDPKHPAPAFPGISSIKFNPVEAERCYKETLKKEVEFRGLHAERNVQSNMPAFLGEKRGFRKMDMIPGYTSVWTTYENLGWGEGLSGKLEPPRTPGPRPQSCRPRSAGALEPKDSAWLPETLHCEQPRSRPSSASAPRRDIGHDSKDMYKRSDYSAPVRIQDAAAHEGLINAERKKGNAIRKLLRPASAPARQRAVVEAPRPNLQREEERPDPNAWRTGIARHRNTALFKERIYSKKLFKRLMDQPLTFS